MSNSTGVTATERLLSAFCNRTFLKLWSYPNPYKDDGKELCDLLAVFDKHVFIFFDRNNKMPVDESKDPLVIWDRWRRKVIDMQVSTAHGAERYIRSERDIFVDAQRSSPFPLSINRKDMIVHKIIIAHGAEEACLRASDQNINGSLGVIYDNLPEAENGLITPFTIKLDKKNPVHVLDSHNLSIVLQELDTVADFSAYLDEKVRAIDSLAFLSYCGEEDLLAHYLRNFNKKENKHFIGVSEKDITGLMIGEGEWKEFFNSQTYSLTKSENRPSYLWDEMIQRTCGFAIEGTLTGNSDLYKGPSAIYEMVKEPRFIRRVLAAKMIESIRSFPISTDACRLVNLMPSFTPTTAYLFLQIDFGPKVREAAEYREKRATILEIACGSAKNQFPQYTKIIGICMEPPRVYENTSEDFLLLSCEDWPTELASEYKELNSMWGFFQKPSLKKQAFTATEFINPAPTATKTSSKKTGRNDKCPCGSLKKYKNCCL